MSWSVLFRIRQYLKGSLWFFPLIGAILGPLVALIVHQADAHVTLPAVWYRDPMLKAVLAILAGTLTFSFSLLRRLNSNHVPDIGVTVAGAFVVLSMVLFLFFLDRFICRRRPVAVAGQVGRSRVRRQERPVHQLGMDGRPLPWLTRPDSPHRRPLSRLRAPGRR